MTNLPPEENFARSVDLHLDLPGILYVEAVGRIGRGEKGLIELRKELAQHQARVAAAESATDDEVVDGWVDVIQGVGGLERRFGATLSELAVADVLLVAAAEAYINVVASHVLSRGESQQFDKLSPVGKWLFLPRTMKLKWIFSANNRALAELCLSMLAQDADGFWILHYLGDQFRQAVTYSCHDELYSKARKYVEEQLVANQRSGNSKLAFRYSHLLLYFDAHRPDVEAQPAAAGDAQVPTRP